MIASFILSLIEEIIFKIKSLSDCSISWGAAHCNHYQDVGVICGIHDHLKRSNMLRSYSYDSNRIKKRNSVTCGVRKSDSKLTRSKRMIGGKVANRKVLFVKFRK